ncbi:hypothetical protein FRB94_003996 [Tulasnella sp. JGI-2019a]|nr:hypothetical protein FRB94_003996 [Tulasnella sp. JGI-2019a]
MKHTEDISPALDGSPPLIHPRYSDELVDLQVDGGIFRVSKALLSQSIRFSKILGSYPSGKVIPLIGVCSSDVESFLDILHARLVEGAPQQTFDQRAGALYIATRWDFPSVRRYMIRTIQQFHPETDALDRYELAMKCRVPQWLHPVYNIFCTRDKAITAHEAKRLGYERLTAIYNIRELFRSAQVSKVCCDHCNLKEAGRPTSPPPPPSANAMTWILEAPDLRAVFPDDTEDPIAVISPSEGLVSNANEEPNERYSEIKDSKQEGFSTKEDQRESSTTKVSDQQSGATTNRHDPASEGDIQLPIASVSESIKPTNSDHQRHTQSTLSAGSNTAIGVSDPKLVAAADHPSGSSISRGGEVAPTGSDDTSSNPKSIGAAQDIHLNGVEIQNLKTCSTCEMPMTRKISKTVAKKGKKNAKNLIYWVCMPCREERNFSGTSRRVEVHESGSYLMPQETTVVDNSTTIVNTGCVDTSRKASSNAETAWLVAPSIHPSSEGDKEEYSFVFGDEAVQGY